MIKLIPAIALVIGLFPTGADAQEASASGPDLHADSVKLAGWFQVAAGGTAENTVSVELDPSIGLGARLEIPLMEWLSLGGLFNMSFWRVPLLQNGRNAWFDFDVMVKGFYGFAAGGFAFEAYAYLPVGVTIATIDIPGIDAGFGWNMGLLFGLTWFFLEDLGALLEMGWLHHHTNHSIEFSSFDYEAKTNQFVMNFGVVLPF